MSTFHHSNFSDTGPQAGRALAKGSVFFAVLLALATANPWQPAAADDVANRTEAKSHRGDYKSILTKDTEQSMEDYRKDKRREKLQEKEDEDRRRRREERQKDAAGDDNRGDHSTDTGADQFEASTYQDTDFSRHSFVDLLLKSGAEARDKPLTADDDSADAEMFKRDDGRKGGRRDEAKKDDDDHDRDKISGIDRDRGKDNDRDKDRDRDGEKRFDELLHLLQDPVPPGPNNWVPDKLDELQNGGFESSPDNGSPVPYNLNGHVNLERGRPWLHH